MFYVSREIVNLHKGEFLSFSGVNTQLCWWDRSPSWFSRYFPEWAACLCVYACVLVCITSALVDLPCGVRQTLGNNPGLCSAKDHMEAVESISGLWPILFVYFKYSLKLIPLCESCKLKYLEVMSWVNVVIFVSKSFVPLQRSHSFGQHRLHRRRCGADRGGNGEGVQRQRLSPHAQELQPLLLSAVRGGSVHRSHITDLTRQDV